ncbi:hypothetical protein JCM19992_09520 [Thermostilla marina]
MFVHRFTPAPALWAAAVVCTALLVPCAAQETTVLPVKAVPAGDFLDSIGVCTTFPNRGQPIDKTVTMLRHCGFRWVRAHVEDLDAQGRTTIENYLRLHHEANVKLSLGLGSGGSNLSALLEAGRILAEHDALLAFEGNNEPNNWAVTYRGKRGGGRDSWLPVAELQRDLYAAVKRDPVLRRYPVWSISEPGAQTDNAGLQFLEIPPGADTLLPSGTRFADFANVHNYIYHPNSPFPADNKVWNAADPGPECRVDGLYGNYGVTWAKKFRGYSVEELVSLPRVTTETGCTIDEKRGITERRQAVDYLTIYLDQFARGWSRTAIYILRDRTDEAGNQSFGFFRPDYTPRLAAEYLHNLTTILDDHERPPSIGSLGYRLVDPPDTTHDLLLQHSDGTFFLVVWNERVDGSDPVEVQFAHTCDVSLYDPTVGDYALAEIPAVERITLTLTDHPIVLAITVPKEAAP